MKTKPLKLFVDQHGGKVYARTVKELKAKVGPGRVSRMLLDDTKGNVFHIGWCVGDRWFECYTPMRNPA